MTALAFYSNPTYLQKQSELTKRNWVKGVYDCLRKSTEKVCARIDCGNKFLTTPGDPKKFCSRSCAATVNNEKRTGGIPNNNMLLSLYNSGLSMADISSKLNCSIHKVAYWMDKYQITKRTLSEAIYLKYNPNGDPFKIKNKLTRQEENLKGLGLGLYWGEGNKVTNGGIRICNTDPGVLREFIKFLTQIYCIEPKKLRYGLLIFNNNDPIKALNYWSNELNVSPTKFGKLVIIPPQGKGTYKKKSEYGVATVSFHNVKLKNEILKTIGTMRFRS